MATPQVYAYKGDNGETEVAKTFATRHDEFRAKYPESGGWSLEVVNELSTIRLRNISGHEVPAVRFTATLRFRGEFIRNASTLQPIEGYKSYESGETNAVSRLLEYLGFGRQLTDQDEQLQIDERERARKAIANSGGNQRGPSSGATVTPLNVAAAASAAASPAPSSSEPAEAAGEQPANPSTAATAASESGHFKNTPVVTRSPSKQVQEGEVPEYLRLQIEQRCKLAGKPMPELKDHEHAKTVLKDLLKAGAS